MPKETGRMSFIQSHKACYMCIAIHHINVNNVYCKIQRLVHI